MHPVTNFIIYIIILFLTIICICHVKNGKHLFMPEASALVQVSFGLLLWLVLILFLGAINILLFHRFALFQFTLLFPKSILIFLSFQLLVAVTEELLFRGLLTELARKLRWHWAVIAIASAAVFGAVHWLFQHDLNQLITAVFLGFAFSVSYQKSKHCSIYSLILAHFLYDISISNVII